MGCWVLATELAQGHGLGEATTGDVSDVWRDGDGEIELAETAWLPLPQPRFHLRETRKRCPGFSGLARRDLKDLNAGMGVVAAMEKDDFHLQPDHLVLLSWQRGVAPTRLRSISGLFRTPTGSDKRELGD